MQRKRNRGRGALNIEALGKPPGCKLIRISAELLTESPEPKAWRIKTISIRGDFFASPEEGFERAEGRLAGTPVFDAGENFDRFLKEEGVEARGIDGKALGGILTGAVKEAHAETTSL
jgi:hypothetical protein